MIKLPFIHQRFHANKCMHINYHSHIQSHTLCTFRPALPSSVPPGVEEIFTYGKKSKRTFLGVARNRVWFSRNNTMINGQSFPCTVHFSSHGNRIIQSFRLDSCKRPSMRLYTAIHKYFRLHRPSQSLLSLSQFGRSSQSERTETDSATSSQEGGLSRGSSLLGAVSPAVFYLPHTFFYCPNRS